MSSLVTATPAGSPSRIATRAGPCDSPAVSHRSMSASLSRARRPSVLRPYAPGCRSDLVRPDAIPSGRQVDRIPGLAALGALGDVGRESRVSPVVREQAHPIVTGAELAVPEFLVGGNRGEVDVRCLSPT